jgi:hypothetical protein
MQSQIQTDDVADDAGNDLIAPSAPRAVQKEGQSRAPSRQAQPREPGAEGRARRYWEGSSAS